MVFYPPVLITDLTLIQCLDLPGALAATAVFQVYRVDTFLRTGICLKVLGCKGAHFGKQLAQGDL